MRLDKYLKVSRLIKRRTVANEACDAGRVLINDKVAKASVDVKVGDIIEIAFGQKAVKVRVLDIQDTTKKEEAKAYNDAVDSPPLYEETVSERKTEKTSLIDEMIIDNMVKGDKSIIGYQRIDEVERLKEEDVPQDTVATQNEKNKSTDKDAYLYDKMVATDKDEAQETLNVESTKQTEKVSETKTEQPKETIQNNDNVQPNEQEFKPLSEILQADLNESLENQVIKELGNTMSDESREAFAQMQMDVAREKLSIAYAELGIEEPAEIIGMQEPAQVSSQSISPLKK